MTPSYIPKRIGVIVPRPAEFTIETAEPAKVNHGLPKSPLRLELEKLEPGQVLRFRPRDDSSSLRWAHTAAHNAAKALGVRLKVRKVDGGLDIYRTE
jgi:hypothetical protein